MLTQTVDAPFHAGGVIGVLITNALSCFQNVRSSHGRIWLPMILAGVLVGVGCAFHCEMMIAIAAALFGVLGAIRYPAILIMLLCVVHPFWIPLKDVAGHNMSISTVLGFLAWLSVGPRLLLSPRIGRQSLFVALCAVIPAVCSVVGSLLTFGETVDVWFGVATYFVRFGLFASLPLVVELVGTNRPKKKIAVILFTCGMIASLCLSLFVSPKIDGGFSFGERSYGIFFNPNILGYYAVIAINWAVCILMYKRRIPGMVLLMVGAACILHSGSRSAFIALLAAGGYWLCVLRGTSRRDHLVLGTLVIAAIAAFVVFALPRSLLADRLGEVIAEGVNTANVSGRLYSRSVGLRVFMAKPFGIGVSNLKRISAFFGGIFGTHTHRYSVSTTDSQFLDMLIETGPVGLAAFSGVLMISFRKLHRSDSPIAKAALSSLIAMCIAGIAGYTFYNPIISSACWLMVALAWDEDGGRC